jgi:hypothetical protein
MHHRSLSSSRANPRAREAPQIKAAGPEPPHSVPSRQITALPAQVEFIDICYSASANIAAAREWSRNHREDTVQDRKWSRRKVLKVSAVSAAATLFAEPLVAAAPPATEVTSALVEAARKEGKVSFYTALELNVAERLSRMFEARYPGIAVRVERSGAERIFQRIAQEQGSGINAVDVANSTDPAHYLD